MERTNTFDLLRRLILARFLPIGESDTLCERLDVVEIDKKPFHVEDGDDSEAKEGVMVGRESKGIVRSALTRK